MIYFEDTNIPGIEEDENGARLIHTIFCASDMGKQAIEFLEEYFCYNSLSEINPSENALYRQGQASVIYQIRQWIRNVDRGVYNRNGDNNGN